MPFFLKSLREHKQNAFLIYRQSQNIEDLYSYEDTIVLIERVLEQFHKLQLPSKIGIGVKLSNHSPAGIILILAILNFGSFFCPISMDQCLEECCAENQLEYIVVEKGTVLGSDYECVDNIAILNMEFMLIKFEVVNQSLENFQTTNNFKILYAITTSGSTGLPKRIFVPYTCIIPNIIALADRLEMTSNDLIYLFTPFTFDPFVVELMLAVLVGASLLIIPSSYRSNFIKQFELLFPSKTCKQRPITVMQTTPSKFRLFGDAAITSILGDETLLRVLILGGEPFPSNQQINAWTKKRTSPTNKLLHTRIFNIYGITEISCWCMLEEISNHEHETFLGDPLERETELRLINSDGQILLEGNCIGELEIGSAIRKSYIPNIDGPLLSAIIDQKKILYRRTGDIVQRIGNKYKYVGRTNNIIKRFGVRVFLDELCTKLKHLLQNDQVACIWHVNKSKLIFFVLNDGRNDDQQSLTAKIMSQLLAQEKPDKIVFINEMPLNSHGKCEIKQLLKHYCTDDLINFQDPISILRTFLNDMFNVDQANDQIEISIQCKRSKIDWSSMSFHDLGGGSFQAMRLVNEISQMMMQSNDKGTLFAMLLNHSVPLSEVFSFLQTVDIKQQLPGNITKTNTTRTNNPNVVKRLNDSEMIMEWSQDMGKCIDSPPACRGVNICVGSHSHHVANFDALTGTEIMRIKLPDRIECEVEFISDFEALVGCYDCHVYAFNLQSGTILWSVYLNGIIKAKPLLHTNKCIVGCYASNYNLVCISLKNHQIEWRLHIGSGAIFAAPIRNKLNDESVLVSTLDGTYAMVNVQIGEIIWQKKLSSPIFSTPAFIPCHDEDFGSIFVLAEVTGIIHICSASDGSIIDSFHTQGNIFSSILAHSSQIDTNKIFLIFGCYDKSVYCLSYSINSKMVNLLWKLEFDSPIYARPAILESANANVEYIVIVSTKGCMKILELTTGSVISCLNVNAEVYSSPCSTPDNRIYFGCRNNLLCCFKLQK